MIKIISDWFRKYFSDPEVAILAILLVFGFAAVLVLGKMLAPVLASLVIAYLLEGLVGLLQRYGVPRVPSVMTVFLSFMALFLFVLFGLLPLVSRQASELVQILPSLISQGQEALLRLPEINPQFIDEEQVRSLMSGVRNELLAWGQKTVSLSLSSLVGVVTLLVFLVLVPLLVFFFLKDKEKMLSWYKGYLPKQRGLVSQVWSEVDLQIGNYVRGKFWEIVIMGVATYIVFAIFGLNFAPLLAFIVGLSVIVPYIGIVVVTVPVAIIAYHQFGISPDLAWLMIVYLIVQGIDGAVLVPLLFSEVTNLHPVAIIVAVLLFGGLWGFWGVFFAIPLATLVKAVLHAWPRDLTESAASEG